MNSKDKMVLMNSAMTNNSLEQRKVLMYLLDVLDSKALSRINQRDLCESLKMYPANVSNALKALQEQGLIEEGEKDGRSKTYKFTDFSDSKKKADKRAADQAVREKLEKNGQSRLFC